MRQTLESQFFFHNGEQTRTVGVRSPLLTPPNGFSAMPKNLQKII